MICYYCKNICFKIRKMFGANIKSIFPFHSNSIQLELSVHGNQFSNCNSLILPTAYMYLMQMAESNTHGLLVAPSTRTPSLSTPTPCICNRNSVLILRAESESFSLRAPHSVSTSSMNIMLGLFSRANKNNVFTNLEINKKIYLKEFYLPI